jgi:hypothetical protein
MCGRSSLDQLLSSGGLERSVFRRDHASIEHAYQHERRTMTARFAALLSFVNANP